jgi:hypothetical protein
VDFNQETAQKIFSGQRSQISTTWTDMVENPGIFRKISQVPQPLFWEVPVVVEVGGGKYRKCGRKSGDMGKKNWGKCVEYGKD